MSLIKLTFSPKLKLCRFYVRNYSQGLKSSLNPKKLANPSLNVFDRKTKLLQKTRAINLNNENNDKNVVGLFDYLQEEVSLKFFTFIYKTYKKRLQCSCSFLMSGWFYFS